MKVPKISLGRVVAEFAVIVLGVLVALGFESWREDVAERAMEQDYLSRLQSEFAVDSSRIKSAIEARSIQQSHIDTALSVLANEHRNTDEDLLSVFMASRSVWSRQIGATFSELLGTGRLQIVKNADLRIHLVGFYSWITVALVEAPGLNDRIPYRDIVRGEIYPKLQEAMRACGGVHARILALPDTNMVSECDYGAGSGDAETILMQIRSNPETLPALRRWAAAFSALEARLEESHTRIDDVERLIATEIALH